MPGQIYLLTAVTAGRRRHFEDFWIACAAARALTEGSAWPRATLLAWVLMPDHLHVLVQSDGVEAISLSMGRAKALISAAVHRAGEPAQVWQPGFHDHALRNDESVWAAARYLVANPLRAGLVACVGDYPFWDCVWLDDAPVGAASVGAASVGAASVGAALAAIFIK